jgi:hypothetical protein
MGQQAGMTEIGEQMNEKSSAAIAEFIKKNTRVIANGLTRDEKITSLHKEKSTGEYYCVQIGAVSHKMELIKVNLAQAKIIYGYSPYKYTESITDEKEIANTQSVIIGVNDHMEQSNKSVDSKNTLSR